MQKLLRKIVRAPTTMVSILLLVVGFWASPGWAEAEQTIESASAYGVLVGHWERPDGGYLITIKGVSADGEIDAAYANPSPLPFSKAEASRDGDGIELFFELRAGGYNGSTYTLVYDPAQDMLRGFYYQAVAKQKYDIQFRRVN
jgi:uncharacterized protein (DUF2147 family)